MMRGVGVQYFTPPQALGLRPLETLTSFASFTGQPVMPAKPIAGSRGRHSPWRESPERAAPSLAAGGLPSCS
jgi:hypothetical protein